MKIISGNSNIELSKEISEYLKIQLSETTMTRFSDKEIFVEIGENVRGEDVFLVQSTSFPANDNLMELLVAIDALKRGSAKRITAVLPYFGYARQDRKTGPRTPISAKLVANLITTAGANRVLTMDLHAGQIQGFFDIPLDNLYATNLFISDIKSNKRDENLVFISPDVGGVLRARAFAKKLDADLAIIDALSYPITGARDVTSIRELFNNSFILVLFGLIPAIQFFIKLSDPSESNFIDCKKKFFQVCVSTICRGLSYSQ